MNRANATRTARSEVRPSTQTFSSRSAKSAWSSSSTNATARSSARTHKAIKEFFPNAQLFGFTGTPIFEQNATVKQIDGDVQTLKTTEGPLPAGTARLHHHPRHRRPQCPALPRRLLQVGRREPTEAGRHPRQARPSSTRFLTSTTPPPPAGASMPSSPPASINDAIDYYELFKKVQVERQADEQPDFEPTQSRCRLLTARR